MVSPGCGPVAPAARAAEPRASPERGRPLAADAMARLDLDGQDRRACQQWMIRPVTTLAVGAGAGAGGVVGGGRRRCGWW